ncbi:MAG: DNA-directed RNA polymerase subunit omega [Planctomycetota bacterium]
MKREDVDTLAEQLGGQFKLTVLIQRRLRELCKGAAPLVETESRNLIDIAIEEIKAGKVSYEGYDLPGDAK